MIVVNRRTDQAMVINGDVTIRVVKITPDKVWLAISAPPGVPVLRQEVVEARADHGEESTAGSVHQ